MDDIEPETLGYRVMDEVAFEITRRAVREKVDNFLKERDLTPTGQERANLYRRNYYHMLFWMMAQPVAKQELEPQPVPSEGKVIWSIDIPSPKELWAKWKEPLTIFAICAWLVFIGYVLGRP